MARELGFDFVDIKHCHGYLGHEFLSAHTREGKYGGSFENRTRFLREVLQGIARRRRECTSACGSLHLTPCHFAPTRRNRRNGKLGPGIPESHDNLIPYRWGFGVKQSDPHKMDLAETNSVFVFARGPGDPARKHHSGEPLLQSAHSTAALYPPSMDISLRKIHWLAWRCR